MSIYACHVCLADLVGKDAMEPEVQVDMGEIAEEDADVAMPAAHVVGISSESEEESNIGNNFPPTPFTLSAEIGATPTDKMLLLSLSSPPWMQCL